MTQKITVNWWLKGTIAFVFIGIALSFSSYSHVGAARAQAEGTQKAATIFNWEYQLEFNASSLLDARQQASSLTDSLKDQGVSSELQSLGFSDYRFVMTGSQGSEQLRKVIYSPLLANFLGGAADLEINMPVGSLLDLTLSLQSNLTTGYSWKIVPSESAGFIQADQSKFITISSGFGAPSLQTLVLHPEKLGQGKIKLVYRRPFGLDENIFRHLSITLAAQTTKIDLSEPTPEIIENKAGSSDAANTPNPSYAASTPNRIDDILLNSTLPSSFGLAYIRDRAGGPGSGSLWKLLGLWHSRGYGICHCEGWRASYRSFRAIPGFMQPG